MTEASEDFTLDSSGYASDYMAYDANGNLTYDGSQVFTYDAWNRQATAAHGYRGGSRGSSDTVYSGQVHTTCRYDAAGRRIGEGSKAIANTGDSGRGTFHAYFSAGYQVLEERNGSDWVIKEHRMDCSPWALEGARRRNENGRRGPFRAPRRPVFSRLGRSPCRTDLYRRSSHTPSTTLSSLSGES